jgi:histidinol phosphatase-like PHP family hydrolase
MMRMDVHIHSEYSDGEDTIDEIVQKAIELRLQAVGIVDHVRADTRWVKCFSDEIHAIQRKHSGRILILCGVEAKCLDLKGNLDMPHDSDCLVDFVVGSIHRIPSEDGFVKRSEFAASSDSIIRYWQASSTSMLRNPKVSLWAHPGAILSDNGIEVPEEVARYVASVAFNSMKFVEKNVKHSAPRGCLLDAFRKYGVNLIPGSDSHSLRDMDEYSRLCTCSRRTAEEFLSSIGKTTKPFVT